MNEEKLSELKPIVSQMAQNFIAKCQSELGVTLLITCAYRSSASQDILYAQGRTTPGNIVTNAKGGQSLHQYNVAFDVVPLIQGKTDWNYDFSKLGAIGVACGLEWGGNWQSFKDMPHFQYLSGYTLVDFQNDKIDWTKFDLPKVEPLQINTNNNMNIIKIARIEKVTTTVEYETMEVDTQAVLDNGNYTPIAGTVGLTETVTYDMPKTLDEIVADIQTKVTPDFKVEPTYQLKYPIGTSTA